MSVNRTYMMDGEVVEVYNDGGIIKHREPTPLELRWNRALKQAEKERDEARKEVKKITEMYLETNQACINAETERDEARIKVGDLSEKLKRLLYITGQLTMLRHKDSEEYETLHAEYISMKFPEFIQKEGGVSDE